MVIGHGQEIFYLGQISVLLRHEAILQAGVSPGRGIVQEIIDLISTEDVIITVGLCRCCRCIFGKCFIQNRQKIRVINCGVFCSGLGFCGRLFCCGFGFCGRFLGRCG